LDTKNSRHESNSYFGSCGGSVIKTLVDEIKFKGSITGVEIDPKL
jgi:spermidine synthase